MEVLPAQSCADASLLLAGVNPPELVLTGTRLADGTWEDVVRLAEQSAAPVNVIVVSPVVDVRLYVEALEKGAFDFITPPYERQELSHVVRSAAGNAASRRDALSHSALRRAAEACLPLFAIAS